jgi:hypothetical protein
VLPLLILPSLCGCPDAWTTEYETEHMRIGTDRNGTVCAGNLEHWEQVISTTEDELGVRMDEPVEVFLWDMFYWASTSQYWCDGEDSELHYGCYRRKHHRIYAPLDGVDINLVRATMGSNRRGEFFDGGIAGFYSGQATRWHVPPSDFRDPYQFDVALTAPHFVAWMRETWGSEKLGQFMRSRDNIDDAFVRSFGIDFAAARQRYLDEAPALYPSLFACEGPEIPGTALGWHDTVPLDCNTIDTHDTFSGRRAYRTFMVEQPGRYSIMTSGAGLEIARCTETSLATVPNHHDSDVPADYDNEYAHRKSLEGGVVNTVELVEGRYQLRIDGGYDDAKLSVWPSLAPTPEGS